MFTFYPNNQGGIGPMSATSKVETVEKNKIKLTIEFSPEDFKKGLQHAYNKNKNAITIQGFRKGKAPRKLVEQFYGKDLFYEDAVNHLLPDAYENALEEHNLDPVYRPDIDVVSMDEAEGAVITAEVFVKPEVLIEGYYGLTYPIMEQEPSEDDIQNRLQRERERNARTVTVDRPSEMGDHLTINFEGFIDGVPFEGGQANDYEITLGSKSFIDTFEEQLVGHAIGDDVEVNVTFPEDYGSEDLKGKPALFKVEIVEIQAMELPELDDEFAQDVSEFETLEEFREDIISKVREEKEQTILYTKRTEVIKQLVEKAEMEVPDAMYQARAEEMTEEMRFRLWQQGLTLEQYLAMSGMTIENLHSSYMLGAKEDVDARLVLEAIAKLEAFEISDDEILEQLKKMALPNQDPDKLFSELSDDRRKSLTEDLLNQKALDFVIDKAVAMEAVADSRAVL